MPGGKIVDQVEELATYFSLCSLDLSLSFRDDRSCNHKVNATSLELIANGTEQTSSQLKIIQINTTFK